MMPLPSRASDLLSLFGAKPSPTSASRMARQSAHAVQFDRASARPPVFLDLSSEPSSPRDLPSLNQWQNHDSAAQVGSSDTEEGLESEDELQSDSNIHVASRGSTSRPEASAAQRKPLARATKAARALRTSRAPVGGARLHRDHSTSQRLTRSHKSRTPRRLLVSDTDKSAKARERIAKPVVPTARNNVRHNIAAKTKPRRDAFILAHKSHFLPLLPENNFIRKLERSTGNANSYAPYVALEHQPRGVQATMKPYQLQGLSFLVHMYENGMSAMLGDEMGLGKTLQTLALFQYLAENKPTTGEPRPYLVICPLSVLSSWISEARKWVPHLNVVRFHGPRAERNRIKKDCVQKHQEHKAIDILVTTYETFVAEQGWFKRIFVWRYCVLDEGHKVKNSHSDVSSALQGLGAEHRLLLTGTPVQNNLVEMWSLLHWLYPEIFTDDTADGFKSAFDLTRGKVSTTFMDDARRLLEVIMLRRMKSSPGVNLGLPPKEEILLFVPLTPMQRFWYQRLLTKTDKATLDELFSGAKDKEKKSIKEEQEDDRLSLLEKANEALHNAKDPDSSSVWAESRAIMEQAMQVEHDDQTMGGWRKLMNLLMQLRKVCSHPYLLPGAAPPDYSLGEHIKTASGKFIVLDKLVEQLVVKEGKKILIFSGFTRTLDFCEDLLTLKGGNTHNGPFRYARLDGSTARAQRNLSIRLFNDESSDVQIMLLSTRAGGLGINLTSATNVVFMDEDWNPQMTLQAEARAHRIGQKNKVTVYKICSQGTVEEQMMGRIRKKLYLSAKITESMRNLHSEEDAVAASKKRKHPSADETSKNDDAPHLDAASLQSLLRRGTQTLVRPQIDVTEMLDWDWQTTLGHCKDKPADTSIKDEKAGAKGFVRDAEQERAWLNSMEKVECAIFEGKKHEKELDKKLKTAQAETLDRASRREGKNTTVEVDGFMINKESLLCGDWEAVPTLAGKDPRLAEPKREKRAKIEHQIFCQCCWDGGEVVLCVGCPRTYHQHCLTEEFQRKANGMTFYCPQHECRDCGAKTSDAGGMIFRCRWCEDGYCEDCLDWSVTKILESTLPEFEMLGYGANQQAHYIECPGCIEHWKENPRDLAMVNNERELFRTEYEAFLESRAYRQTGNALSSLSLTDSNGVTPQTMSEVATPTRDVSLVNASRPSSLNKRQKVSA